MLMICVTGGRILRRSPRKGSGFTMSVPLHNLCSSDELTCAREYEATAPNVVHIV
jgi:hypothetical protein